MGELDAHWWWLLIAAVLGIAEVVAPGVFLIWMAAAAVLTGLAAYALDLPLAYQIATFALLSIASVYGGRRIYDRNPVRSQDPLLNDRTARMIGQTAEAVTAIQNGEGRVRVGDSVWPARGPNAPLGTRLVITGADCGILSVVPAEDQHRLVRGDRPQP